MVHAAANGGTRTGPPGFRELARTCIIRTTTPHRVGFSAATGTRRLPRVSGAVPTRPMPGPRPANPSARGRCTAAADRDEADFGEPFRVRASSLPAVQPGSDTRLQRQVPI